MKIRPLNDIETEVTSIIKEYRDDISLHTRLLDVKQIETIINSKDASLEGVGMWVFFYQFFCLYECDIIEAYQYGLFSGSITRDCKDYEGDSDYFERICIYLEDAGWHKFKLFYPYYYYMKQIEFSYSKYYEDVCYECEDWDRDGEHKDEYCESCEDQEWREYEDDLEYRIYNTYELDPLTNAMQTKYWHEEMTMKNMMASILQQCIDPDYTDKYLIQYTPKEYRDTIEFYDMKENIYKFS